VDEQGVSRLNEIGIVRLLSLLGNSLAAVCVLAAVGVGCTSPSATDPRDGIASGSSSAEPSAPSAPRFAAGGPDTENYGASEGYPIGNRSTFNRIPFLVGSHSHLDQIFEGRLIRRATTPSRLARVTPSRRSATRLGARPALSTTTWRAIRPPASSSRAATRSSSSATSTAATIGIASPRGRWPRPSPPCWSASRSRKATSARWMIPLPRTCRRSAAPNTDARRSGICFRCPRALHFVEEYSGRDDVTRLAADTFRQVGAGGVDAVTPFNERVRPSGTKFSYASVETQVLGLVLRSAVGRPVADYLQEKIWAPIGTEADATWLIDRSGQEVTFCCINAVLRDYARLGLLLAHDGNWRGRQIIPAAWIEDATRVLPDQPHLRPGTATPFFGYGYQVWIFPGERRMFAFLGVRGQAIFVDPASRLVMVHTAVRKQFRDPGGAEATALWRSIVRELGG
jgi:Beta-lactamase